METFHRTCFEDVLGEGRSFICVGCPYSPNHDIELGRASRKGRESSAGVLAKAAIEFHGRCSSLLQPACKFTPWFQWQEPLCCPKRDRGSTSTRTLQADFAEVQFAGGEVGVGRVVLKKEANALHLLHLQRTAPRRNQPGVFACWCSREQDDIGLRKNDAAKALTCLPVHFWKTRVL